MSKTSRSKSKNFEVLYYNLKDEYEQLQKDNDEICKEYESTIQILTDSIKELQNQRSSMTKKMTQMEKEKENLQNKNKEKINDIQELNQKNEKLYKEIININNKNKEKEHQIVILENDTEHYLKLIRQNEAMIDELNYKLEEALEDNVTIQTEFEIYKQIMIEKLSRKSDELKEIKSDMFTKNLMINKLKNKQNKKFIDSNYLGLDGKSTRKKVNFKIRNCSIKNKINQANTYTRDKNYSIINSIEKDLFNNITIASIKPNKNMCLTQTSYNNKTENNKKESTQNSTKIKINGDRTKTLNNSKINSLSDKKTTLKTPSNIKLINPSSNNYSYYTYKKLFDDDKNEFQEIHKFDLNDIDSNDTTSGLNVFQNGNDEIYSQELFDDIYPNLDSSEKILNSEFDNNEKKISKNNINAKPYKDGFIKKLLNSKKLSRNLELLYNYNQLHKRNRYSGLNKLNGKRKPFVLK